METPGQKQNSGEPELVGSQSSVTESALILAAKPQSGETDLGATGPRTVEGKKRSRHNALKYGIFSKSAVLKNESRSEFNSLLNGLRKDLQPERKLEEILVEKIATLVWRYRRLIIAEAAEIRKGTAFVEWDEKERERKEAQESVHHNVLEFEAEIVGLMDRIENPQVLERCLVLLEELKNDIETNGLDSDSDKDILTKLYGNGDHSINNIFDTYQVWNNTAACSDEEREQNGYASIDQCQNNILEELDKEMLCLNLYKKKRASIESERVYLKSLCSNVPESPQLDRLLRYESNLERAFDRALTQLERLKRMRLGQPVLPPVKVHLSS